MLIRIVRMTFQEDKVNDFISLFNATKTQIRHFEGCEHLSLLRDYSQPNVYLTYSHWQNEEALNRYRQSALFESVWKQTKALFADKPIAFSSKLEMEVK